MPQCAACSQEAPDGSRFCPGCGAPLAPGSTTPTRTSTPPSVPAGGWRSYSGPYQGRFIPGTLLAGRYRIFGLIGRGGMGEVYRADDLKLGQAVALKFLPKEVEKDEARLSRFLSEVKVARQISHTNVCRVYDVAEVDGHHFLSMEYVDGEDLASLLRRIGRLPKDKAVQTARQICAGLSAAHEQGILHRDLKPANIMIDGRGRARITDFGLAGLIEDLAGEFESAGTPAYMAPEQLSGKPASVRSDVYALGLVLYELFTGRPAFRAGSPAEMLRLQQQSTPSSPSSFVDGFDPAVERVILRCLEKEPRDRPASVLAVAAALPGGDPLAAALAAGETPSPDLVAEAGGEGAVRPAIGLAMLVVIVIGFPLAIWISGKWSLLQHVTLQEPPDVLIAKAREILKEQGHEAKALDAAYHFAWQTDYLDDVEKKDKSPARWQRLASLRPPLVSFMYRQSPQYLVPWRSFGYVSFEDPPPVTSGSANVRLDPEGRLLELLVVPPERDESIGPSLEPNWSALLEKAGLDVALFEPVAPVWNPLVACDSRAAWQGTYPGQADLPMRIEAGAYRGKPVYFKVVAPWTRAGRMEPPEQTVGVKIQNLLIFALVLAILILGILLARRNLRLGRGDRRGAFRMAFFMLTAYLTTWAIGGHHVLAWDELGTFFLVTAVAVLFASLLWVVYIALEPYVRRLWPNALIPWSRLLAGRFGDPLIGRDILIGGLAQVVGGVLLDGPQLFLISWLGLIPPKPWTTSLAPLEGMRQTVSQFLGQAFAFVFPVMLLFLLLLLRVFLKKQWAVIAAFLVLWLGIGLLQSENLALDLVFGALAGGLWVFVLMRFGLLATVALFLFASLPSQCPRPFDLSTWYAGPALLPLVAGIALAAYGFHISRGGRPLLRGAFLPD